ncbi:MAG: hypothetical protein ACJ72N_27035 [Labedaea sp.]
MTPDDTYLGRSDLAPARHLRRAGQWEAALAALPPGDDPTAAALRAEILVERHVWRLDDADAAAASVRSVPNAALAGLLTAQLEYWRRLFRLGGPAGADPAVGFAAAASDPGANPALSGWATFHRAVCTETLTGDWEAARDGYRRAGEIAAAQGDRFLESYVVRHQGGQLINRQGERAAGIALLRRSLQLRAALGARPQVAAAQLALAGELPPGREADELREIGRSTAAELRIPWLAG